MYSNVFLSAVYLPPGYKSIRRIYIRWYRKRPLGPAGLRKWKRGSPSNGQYWPPPCLANSITLARHGGWRATGVATHLVGLRPRQVHLLRVHPVAGAIRLPQPREGRVGQEVEVGQRRLQVIGGGVPTQAAEKRTRPRVSANQRNAYKGKTNCTNEACF